jgi:putative ABC transport system permease protein
MANPMSWLLEILQQTLRDIWAHKLRSILTMFGISWGIASIIFMMAIGDGFKLGYRKMLSSMGTDIVILWGGRTVSQAGGQRAGHEVRFSYDDVLAIQRECYRVRDVTPELARDLPVRSQFNSGSFSTHGIAPVYQQIRSMNLSEGRGISDGDFRASRCVCVLGEDVKRQLFAGREAVGAQVFIEDVPFTVIGELAKKDQNNSYNGLDGDKVLIAYTAMAEHFPDPRPVIGPSYLDNIIFAPVSADDHEAALGQVKATLGRRHGFRPTDEGAVWVWDTVQSARMVATIYDSMQLFLTCVAVITLGLGGLGVMNIMLVAVVERTREIGVKRAVGAKRRRILVEFFIESLVLTLLSGLSGLGFAFVVCSVVDRLPLPTLFSGLPVTWVTAGIAFGTLVVVGLLAGIYPARHASLLPPVEALRHE